LDADALLVSELSITKEIFERLTKLKLIVRYGVQVMNIPDVMTIEVAEYTWLYCWLLLEKFRLRIDWLGVVTGLIQALGQGGSKRSNPMEKQKPSSNLRETPG